MIREIRTTGPVRARLRVPGSKSITNRALICAALCKGESSLQNYSDSDDTALMANGLNQLGVLVRTNGDEMIVRGTGGSLFAPKFPIPVGNAGTTLRFLLSVSSLAQGRVVFEGAERMGERPVDDLLSALRSLGVDVLHDEGSARYEVEGGRFRGGNVHIQAGKSSQFLSSVLMVAPYASGEMEVIVDGPLSSSSYVEMTIDVMKKFGVRVARPGDHRFRVGGGQRYVPARVRVEADASSASYPFAAAAITGGEVWVEGIRQDSLQGDVEFVHVLAAMGCEIVENVEGLSVRGPATLNGTDVDMNLMPDVVPTLAAVALFAKGKTRIRNVAHLRYKESDRLGALAEELNKLGAHVLAYPDGLEIDPSPLKGEELYTHDDHRLAMSFALIGLRVPGVRIENPECVRKSYPTFWKDFEKFYQKS